MAALQLQPDARAAAFSAERLAWALRYVAAGIPVFPCRPNKAPYTAAGFKDASADPERIRTWWTTWPLAMIGMPTGRVSGLVVLDIDRKNGKDGFATMAANGWAIPAGAVEVRTPSGGAHFHFRHVEGQGTRNSADRIGLGIDECGEGGYVILPPSRPALDGPDYCYVEGQEEDQTDVPIARLRLW